MWEAPPLAPERGLTMKEECSGKKRGAPPKYSPGERKKLTKKERCDRHEKKNLTRKTESRRFVGKGRGADVTVGGSRKRNGLVISFQGQW